MGEQVEIIVPDFTKDDYIKTLKPFEWLYQYKDNKFLMMQLREQIKEKAGSAGVRNFITLWKAYLQSVSAQNQLIIANSVSEFTGQPFEIFTGEWTADDTGIATTNRFMEEVQACNHPIMPFKRLVNIDTDAEKLILTYRKRGGNWRQITVDKRTLASANSIVSLSEYGIAVNSENAKYLVRYLTDVENLNIDEIEEIKSVSRLGWIGNYGFSPYVEDLVFDGDANFKHFFESVSAKGKNDTWTEFVKDIRRNDSVISRIILAASFSSVLIEPCNALPFFVHLWGGTEAGKTVGLMLAASVWADPTMGSYIHTFNSTQVGQEVSATFVNSLPLILDELQIIGERKDFDRMIYSLSEGVGKTRGSKTGGLQKVGSWKNCILTTGEQPITNGSSMSGAINRIIEIDCKSEKLFRDPVHVVDVLKKNHGHAGRQFVERLSDTANREYAISVQKEIYKELSTGESTEKQAMAASVIMAADRLINEWIFQDDILLSVSDITPYLATKAQVSAHERALEFIVDCVAINANKFIIGDFPGEIWGCVDQIGEERRIYFIKSKFDKVMKEEGFNSAAFLSWAKQKDLLITKPGRTTMMKKIHGESANCVCLVIMNDNEQENMDKMHMDDLPF